MVDTKERRKRKRWGDAPEPSTTTTSTTSNGSTMGTAGTGGTGAGGDTAKAKAAALQQSISARLAALKAKKAQTQARVREQVVAAGQASLSKRTFSQSHGAQVVGGEPQNKKAKVYDLDLSITAPTFRKPKAEAEPPKKKINPYLAHMEQDNTENAATATATSNNKNTEGGALIKATSTSTSTAGDGNGNGEGQILLLDNRLAGGQVVKKRRKKELKFVQPGTYIHRAERKREKVANATKSGFVSGRKQGNFFKSAGIANISNNTGNDDTNNADAEADNYYGRTSASTLQDVSSILAKTAPRADVVAESTDGSSKSTGGVVVIPTPDVMEWWDIELLPSKLKKEVVSMERKTAALKTSRRMKFKSITSTDKEPDELTIREKQIAKDKKVLIQKCGEEASIQNSKTWKLIQHPVPVVSPHAPKPAKAPTLHLTKKEMKRQRKLRRAEKQRELQDMQAAGLVAAPEAKLTLSNFMRVLGDQAVLDPSKMEAKVNEQIQARKMKHEKMNAERKLTKEQRAAKRERKLTEDTSSAVSVALFLVKDMSHRYHRTKVDLNAQQSQITGGVLECEVPKLSLVICEGGPKAIKRYIRLMTVRMKWKGEGVLDIGESDDEEMEGGNDDDDDETSEKQKPQKVRFSWWKRCEL